MATGTLTIELDVIARNWRALDAMTGPGTATGAVVKANCYSLGAARVARTLAHAGCRQFYVALAEEGAEIRQALGPGPEISVLSGHMAGDAALLSGHALAPILTAPDQVPRHLDTLPGHPFGIGLDTGMNRLGIEAADWASLRDRALAAGPTVILSHLACADEPGHPMNARQLAAFHAMTDGTGVPRSLAATGGILLGPDFHFDLTRPGVGLYGVATDRTDFALRLTLPVVSLRDVAAGESVGYGEAWVAARASRIATLAGGYADGIFRTLSNKATLWAGDTPCPLVGRVSMDFIAVDVTDLPRVPETFELIGPHQSADALARTAGTIGYEILTALGGRYTRRYTGGPA